MYSINFNFYYFFENKPQTVLIIKTILSIYFIFFKKTKMICFKNKFIFNKKSLSKNIKIA